MKKSLLVVLIFLMGISAGWARTNFSQPSEVKKFELPQPAPSALSRKRNRLVPSRGKEAVSVSKVPVNVLPINIYKETGKTKDGKKSVGLGICSATRLTPTLVLTAAHCLAKEANKGGFSHQERILAAPVLQENGLWRLDLSPKHQSTLQKPNATVIFYRAGYRADSSVMSHAFDLALIKLDSSLHENKSVVKSALQKEKVDLSMLPEEMQKDFISYADQTVNQEFVKQAKIYKRFLGIPLEKLGLLEMTPDVVKEEMSERSVYAYYFAGHEGLDERDSVTVFSGSVLGTDEANQHNTHTLLWNIPGVEGTSGSPILDVQRKLVVSVESGPMHGNGNQGGALVSSEVCQWVKSHDASIKCLRIEGGKTEKETSKTANWGK